MCCYLVFSCLVFGPVHIHKGLESYVHFCPRPCFEHLSVGQWHRATLTQKSLPPLPRSVDISAAPETILLFFVPPSIRRPTPPSPREGDVCFDQVWFRVSLSGLLVPQASAPRPSQHRDISAQKFYECLRSHPCTSSKSFSRSIQLSIHLQYTWLIRVAALREATPAPAEGFAVRHYLEELHTQFSMGCQNNRDAADVSPTCYGLHI